MAEAAAQVVETAVVTDSVRQRKRSYSWRHPVPEKLLRPLSTDRPDATESAYSLDAGHFQMEADVVRLTRLRLPGGTRTQELALSHSNLKFGLGLDTDLQVVVEAYTIQTQKAEAQTDRTHGFGDVTVRLKHTLWGNDGGPTALALLPFVKVPTSTRVGNGAWEGGLVVPFACQLPNDWTLGAQAQATLVRDEEAARHFLELAPTLTVGHDLYRTLGGFLEVATAWDTRQRAWAATFNAGPILRLGDNLQLDTGAMIPLTSNTPLSWFLGLSVRR